MGPSRQHLGGVKWIDSGWFGQQLIQPDRRSSEDLRVGRKDFSEYDELQDLQRAIAGDLDARMRVDFLLPWLALLKDVKPRTLAEKMLFIENACQCYAAMFVAMHEFLTPNNHNFDGAAMSFLQKVYGISHFIKQNEILKYFDQAIPMRKVKSKEQKRIERAAKRVGDNLFELLEKKRQAARLKRDRKKRKKRRRD